MNVSVVLPTYNERGNIVPLIEAIQRELAAEEIACEVIVVDDDSPDGTAQAVEEAFGDQASVRLFVRRDEHGLATAIAHGIRQATNEVVAVMDTDFNHDPKLLPRMVRFLRYYDIVIGSRFMMGGGMDELWRYYASFVFNVFVRLILRTQIQDNLCGFFAMRRDKLMAMDLERIFQGYGEYFMHLLFQAWREGYEMLEIPAYYAVRKYGESKSRFVHMALTYASTAVRVRLGKR